MENLRAYCAGTDVMTAVGAQDAARFGELPANVAPLCAIVQGLLIHRDLAPLRAAYESGDRLRVPPVVFNALRNTPEAIPRCAALDPAGRNASPRGAALCSGRPPDYSGVENSRAERSRHPRRQGDADGRCRSDRAVGRAVPCRPLRPF